MMSEGVFTAVDTGMTWRGRRGGGGGGAALATLTWRLRVLVIQK